MSVTTEVYANCRAIGEINKHAGCSGENYLVYTRSSEIRQPSPAVTVTRVRKKELIFLEIATLYVFGYTTGLIDGVGHSVLRR